MELGIPEMEATDVADSPMFSRATASATSRAPDSTADHRTTSSLKSTKYSNRARDCISVDCGEDLLYCTSNTQLLTYFNVLLT